MKSNDNASSTRLEIPRLRKMRISVSVLPVDENVDSMDMALAVSKALRGVAEIQEVVHGDVDDPRFDMPSSGWAQDSYSRCRIPGGQGLGLVTEQDAADMIGVTKRTVQRWAREGLIESQMHKGERRIPLKAVDVAIEAQADR